MQRSGEKLMSEEQGTRRKKLRLRAVREDRTQPALTIAEQQAIENLLVRRALERGLKVKLPDGTILEPEK
jgi:hypothetical protein